MLLFRISAYFSYFENSLSRACDQANVLWRDLIGHPDCAQSGYFCPP